VTTTPTADPTALLRSPRYVRLLVLAAVLGVPISAVAYGFLALVSVLQRWVYKDLPAALGYAVAPWWWAAPPLVVAGLVVGSVIRYAPGGGGHSPLLGFVGGAGPPGPSAVPGVLLAAVVGLAGGIVLGPEAPLIAIGGGLAVWVVQLTRKAMEPSAVAVVASTGSFATISTLLGSPLLGAFLLMEAAGIGGPMLGLVLLPGLLASGIGSLIFIGLGKWTGLGTFSLSIPDLPGFVEPDLAQFGWAIVIGVLAALLGVGIRTLGLHLRPVVEPRPLLAVPLVGLAVAALAGGYAAATGKPLADVLFSGQDALGPLVNGAAGYSVSALLLLLLAKGLAYGACLAGFRGGPVFPAMFLGAAGGIALSHLPGLPMVPAVAMGIGAMSVVMLRLPITSVMLATLLLLADGLAVMPLVIVSVVVAHVVTARLEPAAHPAGAPDPAPAPATGSRRS
jgi:H+/Cl- antiporter ClcA